VTQAHQHHTIDYIEFTVRDISAAQRFYGAAFGWSFENYGPRYAGIRDGHNPREIGGFTVGEPNPGGPLIVLYSDDLEATLTKILKAGGTLLKEPFTFPGGRRFHFADPDGNELGVWSP